MVLQTLGVVVQAAGVLLLLAHWRAKGGLGGGALAGAWALMVLGAAPWLLTASPEKAAALGAVAPMVFGAALLAPDALPRLKSGKVRRERVRAEPALEAETALPGRTSRNLARWFGALVAAPALSAAVTAAWLALAPGGAFNVAVAAIFLLMAVWTGALLWLLAASHPWRASLIASAAAVIFAAIAAAGAH